MGAIKKLPGAAVRIFWRFARGKERGSGEGGGILLGVIKTCGGCEGRIQSDLRTKSISYMMIVADADGLKVVQMQLQLNFWTIYTFTDEIVRMTDSDYSPEYVNHFILRSFFTNTIIYVSLLRGPPPSPTPSPRQQYCDNNYLISITTTYPTDSSS